MVSLFSRLAKRFKCLLSLQERELWFKNNFLSDFTGKGLTLVNSVIEGKYMEKFADAQTAKQVCELIRQFLFKVDYSFV